MCMCLCVRVWERDSKWERMGQIYKFYHHQAVISISYIFFSLSITAAPNANHSPLLLNICQSITPPCLFPHGFTSNNFWNVSGPYNFPIVSPVKLMGVLVCLHQYVSLSFKPPAMEEKKRNNFNLHQYDSLYKNPCLKIFCSKLRHL